MENNLPNPPQKANRYFNLALVAAGVTLLALLVLLFILNYNGVLSFLTGNLLGSKTDAREGSSALQEELGKQPLPKVDLNNPSINSIIVNYRTVIDSVSPDTPEGTVIETDADGAGVPKFIVAPDTEFVFGPKGSEERFPATLADLEGGQEVVISVRIDPATKNSFLRQVRILEEPNTQQP